MDNLDDYELQTRIVDGLINREIAIFTRKEPQSEVENASEWAKYIAGDYTSDSDTEESDTKHQMVLRPIGG